MAPFAAKRSTLATAALAASVALTACAFEDAAPPDAVVLCAKPGDCPSGTRCDVVSHTCAPPGEAAPALTGVSFNPPVANAGAVRLLVRADRALAPDRPPVVTLAAGAPAALGFALETTDGAEQTLIAPVDDVPEGLYVVAFVSVVSKEGVAGGGDVVNAALVVDRTAPILRNARVTNAPGDGVFADVEGVDVVEVRFLPSEPVNPASAELVVAGLSSLDDEAAGAGCSDDAGEVVCRVHVEGAPDGPAAAAVSVRDDAGNAATAVLDAVAVDTAPPGIVADSAIATITTAGAPALVATDRSVVDVVFLVSEDLAAAPGVNLDVLGDLTPLVLVSQAGRRYTFRLDASGIPAGDFPVRAHLADRFGHAADVDVVAGVPFTGASSLVCPAPAGVGCVDLDGDGHFTRDACVDGNDDDDSDPTVFFGAPAFPGDGADNDGIAGDAPIDESTGLFVDSEQGDDATGDGSRARPYRSLDVAWIAGGDGVLLFLASRATAYRALAPDPPPVVSLVGGLDPATWQRGAARSIVQSAVGALGPGSGADGVLVFDSIESSAEVAIGRVGGLAVRGRFARITSPNLATVVIIDATVDVVFVVHALIIQSDIGALTALATVHRSIVRTQVSSDQLLATSSVFSSSSVPAIVSNGSVTLYHSTVTSVNQPPIFFRTSLVLVDSILSRSDPGLLIKSDSVPGSVIVVDSDLVAHQTQVAKLGLSEPELDFSDLAACTFPGCVDGHGNVDVDPGFASAFHLAPLSPLVNAASVATDLGAPTSVLVDLDGDCRYADAAADIGADEVP